jgi:3-isopropylmalate dehydratase small subunit
MRTTIQASTMQIEFIIAILTVTIFTDVFYTNCIILGFPIILPHNKPLKLAFKLFAEKRIMICITCLI